MNIHQYWFFSAARPTGQCGVACLTVQIKPMDFCLGQGANHSNSSTIARICNAAMDEKTRFYVPDSVQHHTSHRLAASGAVTYTPNWNRRPVGASSCKA